MHCWDALKNAAISVRIFAQSLDYPWPCNRGAESAYLISMTSVRMDKRLWAGRFFKTRAQAARACELGRILSNGQQAKPAREVRVGDSCRSRPKAAIFR
jgi:S4 domain